MRPVGRQDPGETAKNVTPGTSPTENVQLWELSNDSTENNYSALLAAFDRAC
jgi:hypothetical protein